MFSQAPVILSTGGRAWQGGHAWQRVVHGMCDRGCVWQGA